MLPLTTSDTADVTSEPAPLRVEQLPDDGPGRGWRIAAAIFLPLAILGIIAAIAASYVEVPYYTIAPGSVRETEPNIQVADPERAFASEGEVFFTTVSVNGRITPWDALAAWLDPNVEIVDEEVILGGRSASENRERNLRLMTSSKSLAIQVAFEKLGYDIAKPIGAIISEVVPDAAADGVVQRGDVIVAVDGTPMVTREDVIESIGSRAVGDEIELKIRPFDVDEALTALGGLDPETAADPDLLDPDLVTHRVVLGEHQDPERAGRGFLGVGVETRFSIVTPYDVDLDSGSVGGPSAGLAFTLATLDILTEGELTGGKQVAVTGTIDPAGNVGAIGGAPQKTAAVRWMGIDTFIVPASQTPEEFERMAGVSQDDVTIVPVSTLDEALEALEAIGGEPLPAVDVSAG